MSAPDNKDKKSGTSSSCVKRKADEIDVLEELTKLKETVEEQRKKIKYLEKRSYKLDDKLDNSISELYDLIEEVGEYVSERDDSSQEESEVETGPESEPEPETGDDRTFDAHTIRDVSKVLLSSDNMSEYTKAYLASIGMPPANKRAKGRGADDTATASANRKLTPVKIGLSEEEYHKVQEDPSAMDAVFKRLLQKSDPLKYAEAYCKENELSAKQTRSTLDKANKFIELSRAVSVSSSAGGGEQSELDYFLQESSDTKKDIIKTLEYVKSESNNGKPYNYRVLESGMDYYAKNAALRKCSQLADSEPGSGEYFKLKNWLDTLLSIPWNQHRILNIGQNKVAEYLGNARQTMDKVIYGQHETKDVIIQIISKMISSPGKVGNVFAVYGPPGVGKTTIIKDGMSKALNMPFAFLSLGGATDSSYLDGHSYTYEGSTPGKIVELLKRAKCMNPIFYFDELDKVSDTRKGEEVANLLIHLTDPSQNTLFQDKYLGNISLDISKSIFVFSFNDITRVNPILLDRMELIYVKGFTMDEKRNITRSYLIPGLIEAYSLYSNDVADIEFTEENIDYLITYDNQQAAGGSSNKEEGVRQIKRRIENICSQINIIKITNGSWDQAIHSVLDNIPELKQAVFPIKLSNEMIDKMLKNKALSKHQTPAPFGMYC